MTKSDLMHLYVNKECHYYSFRHNNVLDRHYITAKYIPIVISVRNTAVALNSHITEASIPTWRVHSEYSDITISTTASIVPHFSETSRCSQSVCGFSRNNQGCSGGSLMSSYCSISKWVKIIPTTWWSPEGNISICTTSSIIPNISEIVHIPICNLLTYRIKILVVVMCMDLSHPDYT